MLLPCRIIAVSGNVIFCLYPTWSKVYLILHQSIYIPYLIHVIPLENRFYFYFRWSHIMILSAMRTSSTGNESQTMPQPYHTMSHALIHWNKLRVLWNIILLVGSLMKCGVNRRKWFFPWFINNYHTFEPRAMVLGMYSTTRTSTLFIRYSRKHAFIEKCIKLILICLNWLP